MIFRAILVCVLLASCSNKSQEIEKPFYIDFQLTKDSIYVICKNPLACPTFVTLKNASKDSIINLKAFDKQIILRIKDSLLDTLSVLKKYDPSMKYGNYPLKKYDSTYNYNLPFDKGKQYKIMQGHFGKFSHKSKQSRYAIDFRMNVGQPIHAIREGIVINIKENSNEGGRSREKYIDKANYILVYHKDGTFSQYVHLMHNGVVVEKNDSIKKGQLIGYAGSTGFSTAPHLHFAILKPTPSGFESLPYVLDSIPSIKYVKGKFAVNN